MSDLALAGAGGITPLNLLAAVAAIETPVDAKQVVDMAEAFRLCAKKAGAGLELQNAGAEAKLRAEREGGRLLAADPELGKGKSDRLSHYGLARHQSSRWQRVASLPEAEFEAYIATAINEGRELTTAGALQLARTVAAQNPAERPRLHVVDPSSGLPGLDGAQFRTIVADPPWQYDNRGTRNAAAKHYPTMTVADLADLPVEANAADSAHLYLWTTNAFLEESFGLLRAWGFTYKSHLAWVKPQMGMGNYFRISHEHVLFGIRGKAPTKANNLMSWFSADRGRHSAKPESFYDIVEAASDGPYLEMFARAKRLGWTGWGNEA